MSYYSNLINYNTHNKIIIKKIYLIVKRTNLPNFASSSISEGDRLFLRHILAKRPAFKNAQQHKSISKRRISTPPIVIPTISPDEIAVRSKCRTTSAPRFGKI